MKIRTFETAMTKLTFLGTGTSQGVPVISCRCRVCTSDDPRDKRLRASAMVETGGVRIIIDAGPDFRQQMLTHRVDRVDAILLTHEHKDHIGGIDDVRAFNYTSGRPVDIYATERVQQTVRKDFDYAFGAFRYPGVPDINLITIDPCKPFIIKEVEVVPVSGLHYMLPVLGFRIGNVGYLTDLNSIEESEIEKLKGVDVLVINALRREHHISHFTLDEALHVAWLTGAGRTYLTHISHQIGRHAQMCGELPQWAQFACDGEVVEA